jgi:hypothetical protein
MSTRNLVICIAAFATISATSEHFASGEIIAYELKQTIPLGIDPLSLGTDGTNLLVIKPVPLSGPDSSNLLVYNTSGTLLNEFPTGPVPPFLGRAKSVTADGTSYIIDRGTTESNRQFLRMAADGTITGPFGPIAGSPESLGFDGTRIMVSYQAVRPAPSPAFVLETTIYLYDPVTYALAGTRTVTVNTAGNTGINIGSTPVRGVAMHNGDLFVLYEGINSIYRFDPAGNAVQWIGVPGSTSGISFVGDDLFVSSRSPLAIYRYGEIPEPATILLALLATGGMFLIANRAGRGFLNGRRGL